VGLRELLPRLHERWVREPDKARLVAEERVAHLRDQATIQAAGGFHRYTVDRAWRVPQFEKMLYTNALLVGTYLEAYQLTVSPDYERAVRKTCDHVLRDMTDAAGGFYSAEDADSGGEGLFYLWTLPAREIALGKAAAALFAAARARLLTVRGERKRPRRDDKVLTAWNGLMIGALAPADQVLKAPRCRAAAVRADVAQGCHREDHPVGRRAVCHRRATDGVRL
jgi:uncharacterized protein YyaL (SSP411 family)